MAERFDRITFEAVDFLIESSELPKIQAGGSSSSNVLNRYHRAVSRDLALVTTRANILASRASRVEDGANSQGGALTAEFNSLSTRVDEASAYTQVLADMHSSYYVDTGATTATISQLFGQATLPVSSRTELITQTDVYGNIYISPEIEFYYSISASASITDLTITDFIADPEGIFMLKQDQTWLRSKVTGQTNGYVRIKTPLQYRGLVPNEMEIYPFPALAMDLKAVWIRKVGDAEDTWTSIDISYLPNYNAATTVVDNVGPVRLHLPSQDVVEVAILFDVTNVTTWGLKKIRINHVEYDPSATLVVEDPFSRTAGATTLRGKDPSGLSQLTANQASNQVSISMTSTSSISSPVITGVIFAVS